MFRLYALLLLATTSFAQPASKPVGLISRHISVTDKHGNAVKLEPSDLRITVDGIAVRTLTVAPFRERHLTSVVLLDQSGSMKDKERFAKKFATDAVEILSSYGSSPSMCVFNEKRLCNFRAEEVLKELDKIHPIGSDDFTSALDSAEYFIGQQAPQDKTAFIRTIVLITDGDLKDIPTSRLKQHNIIVFPIGLLGPPDSISRERKKLIDLAIETQGRAILLEEPGDIKKQLRRVLDSEYEVLFGLPDGVSEPKEIRITTTRGDLKINPY